MLLCVPYSIAFRILFSTSLLLLPSISYCGVHLPLPSLKGIYDDVVLLHFVPRLISYPDLLSTKQRARSGQIRFVHVSLLPVMNVTGGERAHARKAQNHGPFSTNLIQP